MDCKKIGLIVIILLVIAIPVFSETGTIRNALDDIAGSHWDSHLSTLVGNFTWEDSGMGTGFSETLRDMTCAAVEESSFYTLITHSGPVFNDPEALLVLSTEEPPAAGYMISGTYRMEENGILMILEVFGFSFNALVGSRVILFPMSVIPSGIRVIPENAGIMEDVDESIGTLYGESDLDVYVTTERGAGGVYHDGEDLLLYVLASDDCFIKIFHIDVTGQNTTQIFPNRFEVNNFLPGGRFLRFPGDRAPFKFTLTAPYGSEYIKVVASTTRFRDNGVAFQNLGAATRGLILQEVAIEEREVMAEAKVSYTIIGP